MKRALSLLRPSLHYRADAFHAGLEANGFKIVDQLPHPEPGDLMLAWNLSGGRSETALRFERVGARVVVAENGLLGRHFLGDKWFSLALNHIAGPGTFPAGGPQRWDSWGVELAPWRTEGETVILGQRGIGEPGIRSPDGWAESVQRRIGGRIRPHPGKEKAGVSLEKDLEHCGQVMTWNSSAALVALTMGVSVWYEQPKWIGARAGLPLARWGDEPKRSDVDRLEMFQRAAWACWRVEEVQSGEAFRNLLKAG